MIKIKCTISVHGTLMKGTGGMGDGVICLTCGREWYPTGFSIAEMQAKEATTPEDWALIEKARSLPNGLDNVPDDPKFEAWLKKGGL